jgi:hypothetical protein
MPIVSADAHRFLQPRAKRWVGSNDYTVTYAWLAYVE